MSANSKIQWTDASWNPLRARDPRDGKTGWHCVRISPACKNCYASTFNGRRLPNGGTGLDYVATSSAESYLDEDALLQPLKWRKPKRVFVCSMTDLFGDWVKDEWIDRVFAVASLCPWHTFQILTKRCDRAADYFSSIGKTRRVMSAAREMAVGRGTAMMNAAAIQLFPLPNVHVGFSAENQTWFDRRAVEMAPLMRAGWFVWTSFEPLLGSIKVQGYDGLLSRNWLCEKGIRWGVIGGESGGGSRVCDFEWIRHLVKQFQDANVPVFVKQLGKRPMGEWGPSPPTYHLSGMRNGIYQTTVELSRYKNGIWNLRDKKGGAMCEWPEDLRIREFPEVSHGRA